jgi:uncharacterized protein YecE (DUF72 family)
MGVIRLGTASWADRQLLASGWYPRDARTPASRLAYYASRFDVVEADTSYYAIPAVETTAAWAAATPDGFTFNVKAFSLLTGHPTAPSALPPDLRPARATGQLRRSDLPEETLDELWRRFQAALEPLHATGRLGLVVAQFPPWLAYGEAAKRRILRTVERCRPRRVAVELRHGSWFVGDRALETLTTLQSAGAAFVCVDMPQGHASSVPAVLAVTAEPAVVRFHGHSDAWVGGSKEDKFRYAYEERELAEWADRLRRLSEDAGEVHALFNTCCAGQAQRDCQRLAELLDIDEPSYGLKSVGPRVVKAEKALFR